jgi:DNA primase
MLIGVGSILEPHSSSQPNNHRNIMPKSKFVDFKAVKAAITMEQVLEHYGLLPKFKRSGDSLSAPCPIHKGSNPTQFRVSTTKNVWNCFSECKNGGNTLDFIAKMDDVSILAAANKAIEWFHLDPEKMSADSPEEAGGEAPKNGDARPKPAARPAPVQENGVPNKPLKFRLDKLERSHPYLAERGLDLETIVDFGMGFCAKGMMAGHIVIPIHNVKGELVAYAGRWPGEPPEDAEKYKLPPNFKKLLEVFNLDRAIKEPGPLIIVEGFFDVIKLHQHGCKKVVALMGWFMSPTQEELIRTHASSYSHIIVMLDENKAGQEAREEIAGRLAKFAFVKVHVFAKPDMQPEHLSAEEVKQLSGGFL